MDEWSGRLDSKVKMSNWKNASYSQDGQEGYVISRILCALSEIESFVAVPIKWQELKRRGKKYLEISQGYAIVPEV